MSGFLDIFKLKEWRKMAIFNEQDKSPILSKSYYHILWYILILTTIYCCLF